ncbi:hypothetical protein HB834_06080 [Listeria booriae]|uniref:DNA/RNA non-specific endonuclease n=1 Tax=Listeria booriae TaxID=1552123 RepID=UPI00164E56C9|nr:DNA/RNA non-specific endonuclease [Listeria booriae]MBC6151040.1 hypothetical protein [Listeria booriae]MBC6151211.1 hypothetical protein [Listeria booriae]
MIKAIWSFIVLLLVCFLVALAPAVNIHWDTPLPEVIDNVEHAVNTLTQSINDKLSGDDEQQGQKNVNATTSALADLNYDGKHAIITVKNNQPDFSAQEMAKGQKNGQTFTNLDKLNRVGVANAVLNKSMMPKAEREPLYVNPTGWKNKKITVDGKTNWLYNRSHLIGYQLSGENNNPKNLMTGTREMNAPGMVTYENKIADYLKKNPTKQVRYRVRPVFRNNELVARGVEMEAKSLQDSGISFHVYLFNVEDGVQINYNDGSSTVSK